MDRRLSMDGTPPVVNAKKRSSTVFPSFRSTRNPQSFKEKIKLSLDREGYISESVLSRDEIYSILEKIDGIDSQETLNKLEDQILKARRIEKVTRQELEAFLISLHAPNEKEAIHDKVIALLWTPEAKLRHHLRTLIGKLEEKGDDELITMAKHSLDLVQEFSADSEALFRSKMDERALEEPNLGDYEGFQLNEWLSHYSTHVDREKSLISYRAAKKNRSISRGSSLSLHSDSGFRSVPENGFRELNKDTFLGLVADMSLRDEMKKILNYDYNLFNTIAKVGREKAFCGIGCHLGLHYGLFTELKVDAEAFYLFLQQTQKGYKQEIAYHHDVHAANVALTCHEFLTNGNLLEIGKFDELDIYGLLIAAFIHDLGHPGYNNGYLVTNGHDIAITYNDDSVLENYHVAQAFKMIKDKDLKIFESLSTDEYRTIRKIIIDCVLSTDMARHRSHTIALKAKIDMLQEGEVYTVASADESQEKQFLMSTIIHSSDISNPCKSEEVYTQWTHLLFDEFFDQGDKEKDLGLPVSFLCDREAVHIANSQIGFLTGICIPLFSMLERLMPGIKYMNENIETNRILMESSEGEYNRHKWEKHRNLKDPLR